MNNLLGKYYIDINQDNYFRIANIKFVFGKINRKLLKNGIQHLTLNNRHLQGVKSLLYIDCHSDYIISYPISRATIECWDITNQIVSIFIPDGPVNNLYYMIIAAF